MKTKLKRGDIIQVNWATENDMEDKWIDAVYIAYYNKENDIVTIVHPDYKQAYAEGKPWDVLFVLKGYWRVKK